MIDKILFQNLVNRVNTKKITQKRGAKILLIL